MEGYNRKVECLYLSPVPQKAEAKANSYSNILLGWHLWEQQKGSEREREKQKRQIQD